MTADFHVTPGCYAVIFSAQRTDGDNGYGAMAEAMENLARTMPGFIGIESARGADGFGVTVSYWESEEAIAAWKNNARHLVAQERGKGAWYETYSVRVAQVSRAYGK